MMRREFLGATAGCLGTPLMTTTDTTETYVEQLEWEPLYYTSGDSQSRITPGYIFDRIQWAERWAPALDDVALEEYQSDGYLVTVSVTPGGDDRERLTADDLVFESIGFSGEPTLLRDRLPDASMFVHPTEGFALFEPSHQMDYHTPAGVVVEVAADDLALEYGVRVGDGFVGRRVSLPESTGREHNEDVERGD